MTQYFIKKINHTIFSKTTIDLILKNQNQLIKNEELMKLKLKNQESIILDLNENQFKITFKFNIESPTDSCFEIVCLNKK